MRKAKKTKGLYRNYPFDHVLSQAEKLAKQGFNVHQKFTCAGCGNRLTMSEPNHFFETGSCDNCSTITNIKKDGCNYLVMTKGLKLPS